LEISRPQVDATLSRCPDREAARRMEERVLEVKEAQDSIGGVVTCVCRNVPTGWGEPVFDKLEAKLAQAMLSLPATKGFEIGSGFAGTRMLGSQHNDPFIKKGARLGTLSNHAGGVLGGISNGEPVIFRVAFKPVATIGKTQKSADFEGQEVELAAKGRHDPCVVPRAVPIVETAAALVLIDLALRQQARG
jgi:chorismate synthase